MEDYIAEANTSEDVVSDVVAGTEETNQFVDDNSAYDEREYENVAQPELETETSSVDWQGESKKWQSLYDKSQDNLSKLENALTKAVEMQQTNQNATVNQQTNQVPQVSEEEFNPWDAYYKPDSPSYQMRVAQEQQSVASAIEGHMAQMNQNIALNNTINELKNVHKMPDEDVKDFLQFVSQPKENVGLDNLVKLWNDVNGKSASRNISDSLEAVRNSKKNPVSPGSVQGQDPRTRPKSEQDAAWEGIMGANNFGRLS
tara:strand:+ start:2905 stop:3678 length:774 start_codon:yes stop_codon:yes gene_type:complete